MALAGAIGECAADYLASSLTALIKKDENSVIKLTDDLKPCLRHLVMPETLNGLIGLCALITLRPLVIDRRVVMSEVAARIPALLPWMRLMYCRAVREFLTFPLALAWPAAAFGGNTSGRLRRPA